jgi:IS30 family transposase
MYHCFLQCGCFYIEVAIMKHKHLTYEDRLIIQQELENSTSLHKIAQRLHKSDSTISREIIRNRYQVKTSANHTALCARVNVCTMAKTFAAPIVTVQAALIEPRSVTRHAARTTSHAIAHALPKLRTAATAAHSGLLRPVGISNSVTMLNARRSLQMTC